MYDKEGKQDIETMKDLVFCHLKHPSVTRQRTLNMTIKESTPNITQDLGFLWKEV